LHEDVLEHTDKYFFTIDELAD